MMRNRASSRKWWVAALLLSLPFAGTMLAAYALWGDTVRQALELVTKLVVCV